MELLAYHKWLLREATGSRERLAQLILHDLMEQNPMTFDLVALTGDKSYDKHTLLKAADILLKAKKDQG